MCLIPPFPPLTRGRRVTEGHAGILEARLLCRGGRLSIPAFLGAALGKVGEMCSSSGSRDTDLRGLVYLGPDLEQMQDGQG